MKEHHQPSADTHDESYFASFTDMLVGIIFIFIILLMIVANNFQEATEVVTKISKDLETAQNEARDRERDIARDRARDAERDRLRDELRDRERDAARDRAVAEGRAYAEAQAAEQAKTREDALKEIISYRDAQASEAAKGNDPTIAKQLKETRQNDFNDSREKILLKIQQTLNDQGFSAKADTRQGILIIPENIMFNPNRSDINHNGRQVVNALGTAFSKYLPCISPTENSYRLAECANLGFAPNDGLDAVFIDNYPDIDASKEDKLLLAVQHIVSVFTELKKTAPYLDRDLKNISGVPVLNVKVNQARREARNREQNNPALKGSVVFRFVMRQPNQQDIQNLQNSGGAR